MPIYMYTNRIVVTSWPEMSSDHQIVTILLMKLPFLVQCAGMSFHRGSLV